MTPDEIRKYAHTVGLVCLRESDYEVVRAALRATRCKMEIEIAAQLAELNILLRVIADEVVSKRTAEGRGGIVDAIRDR